MDSIRAKYTEFSHLGQYSDKHLNNDRKHYWLVLVWQITNITLWLWLWEINLNFEKEDSKMKHLENSFVGSVWI